MKIVYLVGSLASDSLNRKRADTLVELAPEGVEMVEAEIKDLPLYNRDLDGNFPETAQNFKDLVNSADGVIFVTPEHNRSFTAAIHNAVEWTSRPYGEWALAGKPVATIGTSPSGIGAAVGQQQLRQVIGFQGPKIMIQPEGYIDASKTGLLEDGAITNADSREFLKGWIAAFAEFVKNN